MNLKDWQLKAGAILLALWALAGTASTYIIYKHPKVVERVVEKVVERVVVQKDVVIREVEVRRPSGEVEITRTTEDKTHTDTASFKDAKTEVIKTPISVDEKRWVVLAGWEPIAGTFYAGGGMSLGAFVVTVDNPIALDLKPRASVALRF